jgi:enoyl-CoA hydratase
MESLVSYRLDAGTAVLTMDDGKANALSPRMFADLNAALDRAAEDDAVVVLTGREGRFSAGFDLSVLMAGGPDALAMLRAGFELSERLLSFPAPVVVACTGHAIAMGSFLLLSGDYTVGVAGEYKIVANEVAIGLTLPRAAVEICRHRLAPAHFERATILSEVYAPEAAVVAGFLDALVPPSELMDAALAKAVELAALDRAAHAATKLRVRAPALVAIRAGIEQDDAGFRASA